MAQQLTRKKKTTKISNMYALRETKPTGRIPNSQ